MNSTEQTKDKIFKILIIIMVIGLSITLFLFVDSTIPHYDDGTREKTVINDLLSKGYRFVLPKDYFDGDNKGKIVLLIHDIDFSFRGYMKFIDIENGYHIKSAFYPRYQFFESQDIYKIRTIQTEGFEVGFQYEYLSMANGNMTLALEIFNQESWVLNSFGIHTTDYHGDSSKPNIMNLDLYNETLWHSLGLNEVYKLQNYSYYTDTNNNLVSPQQPLKDLVIVQLHTDWTE